MKLFFTILLALTLMSCSQKEERSLLFKCVGQYQMHSDSGDEKPVMIALNLFIGKSYAEVNGKKYSICEDNKTLLNFATDCNKDNKLRESYNFFMANHHLSGKDFKNSGGYSNAYFSGEYECEPVLNKNSK